MAIKTPVYLDHNATTPLDPRVLAVLETVQRQHFGNPASNHALGWASAKLVDTAREKVAALIGAEAREIIFTSGATEANNLALAGAALSYRSRGRHLITTNLEHPAVSGPAAGLAAQGWEVTRVKCDSRGLISLTDIEAALRPDTVLVSVICAQNEIGTLQPVADIGKLCKERGILLHTDAAQALGKVDFQVGDLQVDLASFSAHKIYGPKGVGALYVRSKNPRVVLQPQLHGGGQERGLRPGTLNVAGIAAFGEACQVAGEDMLEESARLKNLRDQLWSWLAAGLGNIRRNGSAEHCLPGTLNVSFAGLQGKGLLSKLSGLAVSSSSACSSADSGPSAVLKSLGLEDDLARSSLRLGLGRFTTLEEVEFAAEKVIKAVREIRG